MTVARKYFWTAPKERVLFCLKKSCGMRLILEVDCDENAVGYCPSCGYREVICSLVIRRPG